MPHELIRNDGGYSDYHLAERDEYDRLFRRVLYHVKAQTMRRTGVGLEVLACGPMLMLLLGSTAGRAEPPAKRKALPENLAQKARLAASSEFSQNYLAKFICDGKVPVAEGHDDLNQAWCVKGDAVRTGELEFPLG